MVLTSCGTGKFIHHRYKAAQDDPWSWRLPLTPLRHLSSRPLDQVEAGLEVLTEALELVDRRGDRWCEAKCHRLNGELLLKAEGSARSGISPAEERFHQALTIARHQQAKSLELRAATSLARLWQSQDKRQDAHDLLVPVYEWFTEGFDTADLKDAKALLEELA